MCRIRFLLVYLKLTTYNFPQSSSTITSNSTPPSHPPLSSYTSVNPPNALVSTHTPTSKTPAHPITTSHSNPHYPLTSASPPSTTYTHSSLTPSYYFYPSNSKVNYQASPFTFSNHQTQLFNVWILHDMNRILFGVARVDV